MATDRLVDEERLDAILAERDALREEVAALRLRLDGSEAWFLCRARSRPVPCARPETIRPGALPKPPAA